MREGIRLQNCTACGWQPFQNLRPGEIAGTVPEYDKCPECGGPINVTHLTTEIVPAEPFDWSNFGA